MKSILPLLCFALTFGAAVSVYAETPNEGAAAIRDLIAAKDYETLFPTRYTEWHKTEKAGVEKNQAIARLSQMFEKQHDTLLSVYKQLAEAEFTFSENEHAQVSETGRVATATVKLGTKKIPFRLYEKKDKTWGFHL